MAKTTCLTQTIRVSLRMVTFRERAQPAELYPRKRVTPIPAPASQSQWSLSYALDAAAGRSGRRPADCE